MKRNPFSLLVQLEKNTRQLAKWIKTGKYKAISLKKRQQLIRRIQKIQRKLSLFANAKRVKKAFATAAVVLGLAINPTQAQFFEFKTANTNNPLGLTSFGLTNVPAFGDLDGDGDLDLIIAEIIPYGCKYKYIPNNGTNTNPNYGTAVSNPFGLVPSSFDYFLAPVLADIDSDGDLDVFSISYYGIEYYENEGSSSVPSFGSPNTSDPFGLNTSSTYSIDFADIDGDGDLDAFLGDYTSGDVQYFENTGTATAPAFSNFQTNPFGLVTSMNAFSIVRTVDLDNDGDHDLIVTDDLGDFKYFVNTGTTTNPSFSNPSTNLFGLKTGLNNIYYVFPDFADLDNDGDIDMLVGFNDLITGPKFGYKENNATPTSANGFVTTQKNTKYNFSASDFPFTDNDDSTFTSVVITIEPGKGELKFGSLPLSALNNTVLATSISSLNYTPLPDDLGNPYTYFRFQLSDGHTLTPPKFMFIEVTAPVNTNEVLANTGLTISPNPVTDFLNIEIKKEQAIENGVISIFDNTGKEVYTELISINQSNATERLNISHLSSGIYILKIATQNGQLVERFVKQ